MANKLRLGPVNSRIVTLEGELQRLADEQQNEETKMLWKSHHLDQDYLRENYYGWIQANCPWFIYWIHRISTSAGG